MYTVSFTRNYANIINFQYSDINMASTLDEAISYIALSKPINIFEHHIYDITSDCNFQLTVILGPECIYIILTGYGTRVYDYSHAVAARVFIETLSILMGCDGLEEDE